jgi:hypothetical protein
MRLLNAQEKRMDFRKIIIAAGLAAGIVLSQAPAGHAYRNNEIRDWTISCSNGLTCTMSFSDWKSKGLNQIQFTRNAEPNAGVSLQLSFPPGYEDKGDATGVYHLVVDNADLLSLAPKDMKANADMRIFTYSGDVRAVIDAMKAGKAMEVRYQGGLGTFSLTVPLSGVTASLLYLDEAQDRLQRVDALQAKGDRPAATEAPVRDITTYADIPEGIRSDFQEESGACYVDADQLTRNGGFEAGLDGDTKLLGLPCGASGAYNQSFALYVVDKDGVTAIDFPVMAEKGPSLQSSAFNLDYDPVAKTLTSFYKGRGLGDCGFYYVWDVQKPSDQDDYLVLTRQTNKDDCDGNYMGGPEHWPAQWPIK